MRKQKRLAAEDSNIANLGSDLEKSVRKAASQGEQAWKGLGNAEGLWVWRVEKFIVVPWPKEDYGTFCIGDSYIVLNIYKKTASDLKLSYDIHFWLGAETTQDEAGTAAYKTVELDDFLGTEAVQYREVQEHESRCFQALFPTMKLRAGGIESGFNHVELSRRPDQLLYVKSNFDGVLVKEVPLDISSLNAGDVFLLSSGDQVFQFHGMHSSMNERTKGMQLSQAMREDAPDTEVIVLDQECLEGDDPDTQKFFSLLKGNQIPRAVPDPVTRVDSGKRLFKLSDGEPVKTPGTKLGRASDSEGETGVFDAKGDAARLFKMLKKKIGCDHKMIISILGNATVKEREELTKEYKQQHNRCLLTDIQKQIWVASNYKNLMSNLLLPGVERDAMMLNMAIKGAGCNSKVVVDILTNLTNEQMKYLRMAYADITKGKKRKEKNGTFMKPDDLNALAFDVEKEFGSVFQKDTKTMLLRLIEGQRNENAPALSEQDAHRIAKDLLKAGEKNLFTDEETFIDIFTKQSLPNLERIFVEYEKISKRKDILKSINTHTGGILADALETVAHRACGSMVELYSLRLYESMKGLGTNDLSLQYNLTTVYNLGIMEEVKRTYYNKYNETLNEWIIGDVGGLYETLALEMVGNDRQSLYGGGVVKNKLEFTQVAANHVTIDLLDSADTYVFDNGYSVTVWIGRYASDLERRYGIAYGQEYLRKSGLPPTTSLCRMLEGGETSMFRNSFDDK